MLTRLALVAAMTAVPAAGCAKKTAPTTVVVVDDTPKDKGGGAAAPGGAQDESLPEVSVGTVARKPPAGKPVHVRAALHGVGDLFALIKQTTAAWTPKQPIDPAAQIQAILLQLGYGPGLWSNLDLAGPFTVDATFPYQDPGSDLKLVGSLAALSAKGVMDGMPSSQRPQPLGGGVWELIQGEMRVYLREQSKALEFALGIADLDRAGPLVAEAGKGRRLQLRAWDMPQGMLGNLNLGLPAGLGRQLDAVLRDTKSAALEVDAGTDRDLTLQVSAEAPFARLGLSPLDIDVVFIGHLHFDHAGGLKELKRAGCGAEIHVHCDELWAARAGGDTSVFADDLVDDAGRPFAFCEVSGEYEIAWGVSAVMTPGHTAGHMSMLIELPKGRPVLLAGDAADLQENLDDEIAPGGLVEGGHDQAVASIRKLKALAQETDAWIWPNHDWSFFLDLRPFPEAYS